MIECVDLTTERLEVLLAQLCKYSEQWSTDGTCSDVCTRHGSLALRRKAPVEVSIVL